MAQAVRKKRRELTALEVAIREDDSISLLDTMEAASVEDVTAREIAEQKRIEDMRLSER